MSKYPRKLFYKIGEVCDICGVEAHVLRYWESEFPALAPRRNKSGQRIYRQKDLEIVDHIKRLLYQEKYTIAGASRQLAEQGFFGGKEYPLLKKRKQTADQVVAEIKEELRQILLILDPEDKAALPSGEVLAAPARGTQLVMREVLTRDPVSEDRGTPDSKSSGV